MHGVECVRCHQEVRYCSAIVGFRSHDVSSQPNGHRYDAVNNADPEDIPPVMRDVLRDLTQMEEMLCSLASPCFLMWVSSGGQFKSRGNVITFAQDINQLCLSLPRLPENLDVLVVRKPGARNPSTYKDFRVRKQKVLDLLRHLKRYNPYYADITLRPSNEVDLPEDGDIVDRLPHTRSCPVDRDENMVVDESSDSPPENEPFVPDSLLEEENVFVPDVVPGTTELDAIRNGMHELGLRTSPELPLPWPPAGDALSEYTTEGLFTMAFPSLFPLGKADFKVPREKKLELYKWAKHLMRYKDSRFATHPRFRFFALNLIFRHRAMHRGRFLFTRDVGQRNMTIAQLRNALQGDNGAELAAKIIRCVKTVRGTRPYWSMEGGKLHDMIAQLGTPTFFYTLSMADMSWPDLHKLMPDDTFRDGLTDSESYLIRSRNVANNPHIVSAYLSTKHRFLRETILQHLGTSDDCSVEDFWYRVEWQSRGSGATDMGIDILKLARSLPLSLQVTFTDFFGLKTRCLSTVWIGMTTQIFGKLRNIFRNF